MIRSHPYKLVIKAAVIARYKTQVRENDGDFVPQLKRTAKVTEGAAAHPPISVLAL
jgi:hypothetical protein